jgi:phosphonate metabolism protein PhnN/1,5-bisphosphokinase (PRPP-forming)
MLTASGHLVLVVGPSGAGKDSVLNGARARLAGDRRFVFPRRFVTRYADHRAEDHFTMTDMEFAIAVAEDVFALWWTAHGNSYGIGRSIEADLNAGAVVAVNCSRAVIGEAIERYSRVTVVEVTAPPEVLVSRIVARGREDKEQALRRVTRQVADLPAKAHVVRIVNDGDLADAVQKFSETLEGLLRPVEVRLPVLSANA